MEAVKLVKSVLLLVVFVQVVGALGSPVSGEEEDGDAWRVAERRADHDVDRSVDFRLPLERGITIRLADLIKRSKAQQFHGLMGRSSGASRPVRLGRKRNKGEMFVGLMGRRSLGEDTQEEWQSY
ncbi:protachykinin-like [Stegastes partitus]|uniref:Protachykinin-like n=1 Tax=Stegastes partitus TaxID=144197 RepID=A0A9Y4KG49_9TELE|nr:PREDICTED: protachykinin-like [Stegastes partitus]